MEFLILLAALVFGFIAGWYGRERHAMLTIHKLLEAAEEAEENNPDKPERMRLERHGEVIYAFTTETDTFIAQGSTLEELDAAIQKRFPGKKFLIKESNLEEVEMKHERI
jgi:hypothetical protein